MIRQAVEADCARLAEIHVYGWRFAYKGIISNEALIKDLSVEKRITEFKKNISEKKETTYIYEEHDIIKGFMTIGECRDEDKNGSFELWGIYVEPTMKREGIGGKLLKRCEEMAIDLGKNEIYLWVLENNLVGRRFYEKNGYKEDGSKKEIEKFKVMEIRYHKNLDLTSA